jgi:hypothetical protein
VAALVHLDRAPPLPSDFAGTHRLLEVTPLRDSTFTYRLAVPRDFRVRASVGERLDMPFIQRPIGVFGCGGAPHGLQITVTTTPMPVEIRIEDWVRHVASRSRFVVHDERWHDTPAGPRHVIWGTRDRIVKGTVAFADGGRLWMAHCMGDARRQPEVAAMLWWSAMPLRVVRPGGPGWLEARRDHACGGWRFSLPWSWARGSEGADAGGAHTTARLVDPRGPVRAKLRVHVGDPLHMPIVERRAVTLSRLRGRGWTFARHVDTSARSWYGRPEGWEVAVVKGRCRAGSAFDLCLAHGPCDGVGAEIVLAGAEETARAWMRGLRALEIAAETLARCPGPRDAAP